MGKFCCFFCPKKDYTERELNDTCETCGMEFGFPLTSAPSSIGPYRVVKPLSRGFYAATYVAERGVLRRKVVLKVSPVAVLAEFSKDFEKECQKHLEVAQGADHIVQIQDMLNEEIMFCSQSLQCHVAELEYVSGEPLVDYFNGKRTLTAASGTQIAIDLLRILDALQKKQVNHNDLHSENILVEDLTVGNYRAAAIDGSIRVVAIDLGSLSDGSKSDESGLRWGDRQWIAMHLQKIWRVLLENPDRTPDLTNRVANALLTIGQSISPQAVRQRAPTTVELIQEIETAYYRQPQHWRPWREPPTMKAFSASYNAQTMQPWHVPYLLVDPDDQWRNAISAPGPQVITGMRGCGKTMLLRSLQFHARGTQLIGEENAHVPERLRQDNYVGLFVSAQRLLDTLGQKNPRPEEAFVRLFVAYAVEAVRAIEHLRDIDSSAVPVRAFAKLSQVVSGNVVGAEDIASATSEYDLEQRLNRLFLSSASGEKVLSLRAHPSVVFPQLAVAVRACGAPWQTAQVLFLLDDVSTRYLEDERIQELLSALLFQDPVCSFKLTSEVQTMYAHMKSPGEIHLARIDRDVKVFDLGARVYEKIKMSAKGKNLQFVAEILKQRAERFSGHPEQTPDVLLGNVPLEAIAKEIATTGRESGVRKRVYRGIAALAGMCVGDIGDVISLYEQILHSWSGSRTPIPAHTQSECFQDFCARRLYDLNRRDSALMDMAKAFAEASYALLVKSGRDRPEPGKKWRIRQYSAIYVRVTTGDKKKQMKRLRELVDAGVFVFAGGSSVPRSKTKDANPTQQFKLTYRKIYGLVNYIGLSDRDRFELSGGDLEQWINTPRKGKEILLRNLTTDRETEAEGDDGGDVGNVQGDEVRGGVGQERREEPVRLMQGLLFGGKRSEPEGGEEEEERFVNERKPLITDHGEVRPAEAARGSLVFGLGFEERTEASLERLCVGGAPQRAWAVQYPELGRSRAMVALLARNGVKVQEMRYADVVDTGLPSADGHVMVDITGLAKPVIFAAVRNELLKKGRAWVCHTEAETYYPRDTDLARILAAWEERGRHGLLEELPSVLTGEEGPYRCHGLLASDADESRQRVLYAFSSAKHERLLSLLDERDYDRLEIVVPAGESTRCKVAGLIAEIAAMNYSGSNVGNVASNDLDGTLLHLARRYKALYVDGRQNFEVGLTGSKLQAVACAAGSAAFKFSQCWYLQPKSFDVDRFTSGVGRTKYYEISLKG